MRLKTLYFNKTIFLNNITRFWPVWALYSLIWLFAMPVSLWGQLTESYLTSAAVISLEDIITKFIIRGGFITGSLIAAAFGILAAMAVFSYLYTARSAGMYHALPVKRESLFLTNYLSGLSFLVVPNVVIFLISAVVGSACGYTDMSVFLSWLGIVSAMSLFFYSFAVFCAMFTGNLLALPVFYIILNFIAVGIEVFVKLILRTFVFGMHYDHSITSGFLSPLYQINTVTPIVQGQFACWDIVIVYAAVGVVLAGLALFVYRKRRAETAGDIVAAAPVKPIFKYGAAFCTALLLGCFLNEIFIKSSNGNTVWITLAFMLVAGFIGYYASEMLLKKTVRVIKRGLKGWLIFSGVLILLTAAVKLDVFGYERYVPDVSKISAAYAGRNMIYTGSGAPASEFTVEDAGMLRDIVSLHAKIVENKEAIENYDYVYPEYIGTNLANATSVAIYYAMKDGSTVYRTYMIPVSAVLLNDPASPASTLQTMMNEPDYIVRSNFPKELHISDFNNGEVYAVNSSGMMPGNTPRNQSFANVTLNQQESYQLYIAITKDIEAGNIGKTYLLLDDTYFNTVYTCVIALRFNWEGKAARFEVEKNSVNTIAALKSMGLLNDSQFITQGEALGMRTDPI